MFLYKNVLAISVIAVSILTATFTVSAEEEVISDTQKSAWITYGEVKTKPTNADSIPGQTALRATVERQANRWDSGVLSHLPGAVTAGERVTIGFYARAHKLPRRQPMAIVTARVQKTIEPYDEVIQSDVQLDKTWAFYCITGLAKKTYDKGQMSLVVQLAEDDQVIELGPFVVSKTDPESKTKQACEKTIEAY